ncbi:MAG: hypothetical protein EXS24_07140 [Pedosphaera sp.]|nr:hypothetical protein [Pedosphaera sp.]
MNSFSLALFNHAFVGAVGEDLIPGILLGLVFGIAAVAGFFYLFTRRHLKLIAAPKPPRPRKLTVDLPETWLAIHCANPKAVQEALSLNNARACSCQEGFNTQNENHLFIPPPLRGWTLVIGPGLPVPERDVDEVFHLLVRLSLSLGEVCYFHSRPAFGHHAWGNAVLGRIQRGYAWSDGCLWNQGKVTAAENDLGLDLSPVGRTLEELTFVERQNLADNTARLQQLASRWSVSPVHLQELPANIRAGIAGELNPIPRN